MLCLTFACMCVCSQRWHLFTQPQAMRANYPNAIIRAATLRGIVFGMTFAQIFAYARIPTILFVASVVASPVNASASHAD
jgi:hypothetical protein